MIISTRQIPMPTKSSRMNFARMLWCGCMDEEYQLLRTPSVLGLQIRTLQAACSCDKGRTLAVSIRSFFLRRRKSQLLWIRNQNSEVCPKNLPNLMDISGVMDRLPSTISLIARGETPIARPSAFCESDSGTRYSSRRISPGVTGFIYYSV